MRPQCDAHPGDGKPEQHTTPDRVGFGKAPGLWYSNPCSCAVRSRSNRDRSCKYKRRSLPTFEVP